MATTLIQWLGHGLAADLPNAATLDGQLPSVDATARYYAYDTGADYVLDRDAVAWVAVGGPGSGPTPNGSNNDILTSDGAGDFGTPITPATGIATWLATPSSANLRSALTDESGTGAAYFQGGDIGTPSAGNGSNLTGLNASNLSSGTVAAARGGAGTINGILKADGAGNVSAASAGTDYAAAPSGSANTPLFDDGSGGFTNGTRSGNTTAVVTTTGSLTTGHLAVWDAGGNAIDGGAVPSGGSGGIGDVTGGSTSTDGELAAYDGTTGKALKQSFAKFSGPATSVKTYTLPNASATILTDNAVVTVAQGGTNASSASGTALDNITGFSSTGFIKRTGAGTYSFSATLANSDLTNSSITLNAGTSVGLTAPGAMSLGSTYTIGATSDKVQLGGLGLGIAAPSNNGQITTQGGANNITLLSLKRNTDTSPTGKFVDYLNAAGSSLYTIDITGTVTAGTWQGGVIGSSYGGAGTVNGILKANGSGTVSAASAGTDYVAPTGVGLVFNILLPIAGVMTNGELLVPQTIIPACSFPSGAAGSYGSSTVAATGSATITAKKNGVAFATFAWSASGTAATVTIASTTSFNGTTDKLSIEAPATADATLADIGINLAGTRA